MIRSLILDHYPDGRWCCCLVWRSPIPWLVCDAVAYSRWLVVAVVKAAWAAWRRRREMERECRVYHGN